MPADVVLPYFRDHPDLDRARRRVRRSLGMGGRPFHSSMAYGSAGAGGLLFLGPLLMILFRQKSRAGGLTGIWNCSVSSTGRGPTWC